MSIENAPNPEIEPGKAFEKFMRRNTLPNPYDWDDNPLQRGAVWTGKQVYTINNKSFNTDTIVLTVKSDVLETEKGEQPNSFEAILFNDGQEIASLEYISTAQTTLFYDYEEARDSDQGFLTISNDVLDEFMSMFDEGTGLDSLEFHPIDFNGPHNSW
jgi:hypothetical protein